MYGNPSPNPHDWSRFQSGSAYPFIRTTCPDAIGNYWAVATVLEVLLFGLLSPPVLLTMVTVRLCIVFEGTPDLRVRINPTLLKLLGLICLDGFNVAVTKNGFS